MTTAIKANREFVQAQSADVQKMIRAIRRQLSLDKLLDVSEHGADSGWPGFTYTSDCVKFYNRHSSAIWEILTEEADSQGYKNAAAMIAEFKRADMVDSEDNFKNLLAWYALEYVARGLTENND